MSNVAFLHALTRDGGTDEGHGWRLHILAVLTRAMLDPKT